ncbi:MAG TPA: hypothetical protein VH593_07550 [Ktedonobacteraceae bacterium]|jgi:hypothetical protein
MSYGLYLYAVEIESIRKLPGTDDQSLRAFVFDHPEVQEAIATASRNPDVFTPDAPTIKDVLASILNQDFPQKAPFSYVYSYGYLALCKIWSHSTLYNHSWTTIRYQFVDKVTEVLESNGLPNVLWPLIHGGPCIKLPACDTFPFLGYMLSEEANAMQRRFREVPLDVFAGEDEGTYRAIEEIYSWFDIVLDINTKHLAGRPPVGIIAAYY